MSLEEAGIAQEVQPNDSTAGQTYSTEEMQLLATELERTKQDLVGAQQHISKLNKSEEKTRHENNELKRQLNSAAQSTEQRTTVKSVDEKIARLEKELARRDYEDAITEAARRQGTDPTLTRALMLQDGVPDVDSFDRYSLQAQVDSRVQELADQHTAIRQQASQNVAQKPVYVEGADGEMPSPSDPGPYLDYLAKHDVKKFNEEYERLDGDRYILGDEAPPSMFG